MASLPTEILYEILDHTLNLQKPPSVAALITTCSVFRDICLRIVYSALHFNSGAQLSLFVATYSNPELSTPWPPRSVELDITSDESNLVFTDLYALFSQCFSGEDDVERDKSGRICLDLLRFRLNSHAFDPNIEMIYNSLSFVNPRRFIWTGPDPPHHFSIAIVPQAIPYLFRALSEHTNLTELKLTHINLTLILSRENFGLPAVPSLRSLYLGQVIFLHPLAVASLVLNPSSNFEKIQLVDAYRGSIWGFRLRRSDIELAATESLALEYSDFPSETFKEPAHFKRMNDANLATIRKIVICEARTERIMGGDRVEENAILV